EADSDPTRFLSYLIAALQTVAPQVGTGLANALSSPQPPSTEAILTALLNELAGLPDPFTLVLDDYHVLDSSAVDAALAFLIDHLPPHLHLVITTREDPRLPLPRYRARGQLTELRAADLRFSPAEAANYLNQVMGLNLSPEDIAALETRTEGWIAGLQLAALSLQGHQDAASFIQSFTGSHRFVLDYLVEEVLQRQPAGVQRFLLRTSLLDQMCGPLCDAVLRDASLSAQETLEHLERANLFIVPLDQERRWYRYHHLFGAFLRQRLQSQAASSPTDPGLPELHLRASQWYEENGSRDQAIRHALTAGDFARAADLVELAMPAMRRTGQDATLLGWLQALPDEVVRCRPVLSAGYAGALLAAGQPLAAEARLRDAEQWLDAPAGTGQQPTAAGGKRVVVDQEQLRRTPGIIALIRAGQALARGDLPETVRHARRALEFAPDDDHLMCGGAQSQLGLAAWTQGDLETARRMTADGMANVRLAGHISTAIGCAIVLADVQTAQGRLREAMGTYEQALRWATAPGAPVLRGAADMHVGLSSLLYEHNDLEAARQHLPASQSLGHLAEQAQNPYR
ncbi:MAG TPA: helix-turn-helix transcriptional regulator, partial [Anaerolineae bacterium]|nr:helix-turn-helix transcriptional regulator [Anaerolineae bacterium]